MNQLILSLFLAWNTHRVSDDDLRRLAKLTVMHAELNSVSALMMASIFFQEGRLMEKPPRHGFGCGVGQVLPVKAWGRPTCDELETYEIAVTTAAKILARCHKKFKSINGVLGCYHGLDTKSNLRYANAVLGRIKHLEVLR
ncbi:MAG: hypothetical protein UY96_C0029G0006 [Parcubacteria group bacterium GW2011_GWB1_56_8]|nr:MAG: hypothetical protein UY96_C0029G0006 [Parcubacteria group bacterium GW2011_GWB1_56_8]